MLCRTLNKTGVDFLTAGCRKGLHKDPVNPSVELKEQNTSQACLCTESLRQRPPQGAWMGESQNTCTSV